jgi:hypothetical protein
VDPIDLAQGSDEPLRPSAAPSRVELRVSGAA